MRRNHGCLRLSDIEDVPGKKEPSTYCIGFHVDLVDVSHLTEQAPVEADTILGDLVERGRKHGVSAPLVQAGFVILTIYQQGRARAKAAGR